MQPAAPKTFVGIGECAIATEPGTEIIAANLGSCLGVAVYDTNLNIGGMVHCLLPLSSADPEKAKTKPCLYVDTGVAYLLTELINRGAKKNTLVISVAGGSQINDDKAVFEIGKRNHQALRKILWKNNLLIRAEDIGGNHSRTVALQIPTGAVTVKALGESKVLEKGKQ